MAAAIAEFSDGLLAHEGVVGVAESVRDGQPCMLIYIKPSHAVLCQQLPQSLAGFPVRTELQSGLRADTGE